MAAAALTFRRRPALRARVWLTFIAGVCVSAAALAAATDSSPTAATTDRVVSIIMSDAGFNSEIVPLLQREVAKQGFELKWVVVNDIIQPNKMVNDHTADTNSFQHEPYFDQFVRDHGLKNIQRAFYTTFTPSGLYSRKYTSLDQLPAGAVIGIPVDPANNGRALFMLRDHGLLQLRPGISVTHASVRDITANPRRLVFREVDQLMLLRTLDSVDVCFLFSANALLAGLNPRTDALALEKVSDSPYRGMVAAHTRVLGTPKLEALRRAFHSEAVHSYYRKRYGDSIIFLETVDARAAAPTPTVAEAQLPETASPTAGASGSWASRLDNIRQAGPELAKASLETLFMLVVTIPLAVLLGAPLGTLLFLIRPGSFVHAPRLYVLLNGTVNFVRSFPFLILLIALIPVTKLITGSALGTLGAIVPMVVNSIPYFARFVEQNLLEVNRGVVEAAQAMGASRARIVWNVLLAEARSGLANSVTILAVSFLSYSTVAGLVGGGGIGDFAIRYGYYRYQTEIMVVTIALIIVTVQLLQFGGNVLVRRLDKRL